MGILEMLAENSASPEPYQNKPDNPTPPAAVGIQAGPLEPAGCAGPCPACSCNVFWWNIYEGGPFCAECQPSTVAAMVRIKQFIFGTPGNWYFEDPPEKTGKRAKNLVSKDVETSWTIEREGKTIAITSAAGRVDPSRVRGAGGRWAPPLVAGMVGDMTADEDWQHWQAIQPALAEFQ